MSEKNIEYKMPAGIERMLGLGGLGAGLGGLIGQGLGQQDLMKVASPYLQQIQGSTEKYMNPYVNAGQGAMGTLQGQYQNLLNNPGQMYNQMGAGYQQSPGYQFGVSQATNAANNAAAAGGYLGTPQHQQEMAKYTQGLASQDYDKYMQNILGMYGQGLSGMGNINQLGYNASSGAMNSLNDMHKYLASLAYNQAANEQSSAGGLGAGLGGLAGSALGLAGGPLGSIFGSKIGGMFGHMFD